MIEVILYLVLLVLGIPTGLILSRMCKEEIKNWRKKLKIMSIICLLLSIIIALIDFQYKIPVIIALFFIIIVNLTVIWKRFRK